MTETLKKFQERTEKEDLQSNINTLRKLQIEYLEIIGFLKEISTNLNNSFDVELNDYKHDSIKELINSIDCQLDVYSKSSLELSNINCSINNLCELIEDRLINGTL
jgi:hypothetical protein